MIAELTKDFKFVRFEWFSDSDVMTVLDFDLTIQTEATRNVNVDVAIARGMWMMLKEKGYERVRFRTGGVATDHINYNG